MKFDTDENFNINEILKSKEKRENQ